MENDDGLFFSGYAIGGDFSRRGRKFRPGSPVLNCPRGKRHGEPSVGGTEHLLIPEFGKSLADRSGRGRRPFRNGQGLGRDRKGRGPLLAGIFVNLGIIFVFKYLVFTLENLNLLFGGGLRIPVIDLPIGISFFTLQALSYILDVRRGRREAQKNPVNVGLYIAFFPQLIAGPIVRYETIADEIRGRHENWEDFSAGVGRFVFGLGKKVLLANPLALVADEAVRQCLAGTLSVSFAWVGASVYILQLYFDFSGYSDMAIGLGRMFGFHFLENFRYPYTAKTLTDFWRRWHISLGSWFQDYVYIPLGGSRVSKGRMVLN
ncbi:MAG: MBOAT family protein, partial [Synergistales bacterium]|nr:MBOAT family protein [Synergistales bacterium]